MTRRMRMRFMMGSLAPGLALIGLGALVFVPRGPAPGSLTNAEIMAEVDRLGQVAQRSHWTTGYRCAVRQGALLDELETRLKARYRYLRGPQRPTANGIARGS